MGKMFVRLSAVVSGVVSRLALRLLATELLATTQNYAPVFPSWVRFVPFCWRVCVGVSV